MKAQSENTPIEKTKCGTCTHFDNDCPHGNTHKTGLVQPFFADKCREYKKKEK